MIGGSVVGQSKVLMHDDFTVNFKNRFLSFVSLRIVPYGREHLLWALLLGCLVISYVDERVK